MREYFLLKIKSYLQMIWTKPTDFPSRRSKPPLSVSFIRRWMHSSVQDHTWFTELSNIVGGLLISISFPRSTKFFLSSMSVEQCLFLFQPQWYLTFSSEVKNPWFLTVICACQLATSLNAFELAQLTSLLEYHKCIFLPCAVVVALPLLFLNWRK